MSIASMESEQTLDVLDIMQESEHEQVLFCQDKETGLKAIIAIHNTVLGPSLGGTRMWNYENEREALIDVLRLSRGMSYKSALAGLDLGGGKAVIIGDSRKDKSEALFRRFGRFVDSLNGRYITAEDVGISTGDIVEVSKETDYVAGLPREMGGSGDPSPVTAYGVFMGMKAAAKVAFGTDDLNGRTVAVQGVGSVGEHLCNYVHQDGGSLIVTDIHVEPLNRMKELYGAQVVAPDEIYDVAADIYSPCALGATINDDTLGRLKCSVIAGAANNQLADEQIHGKSVMENGILYAPDFLINAGGIINCFWELKGYNETAAMNQTAAIYDTTLRIFEISQKENIPTYLAANRLAEDRINSIKKAGLNRG